MKENISGYACADEQTKEAMRHIHRAFGYIIDPHGAVGYLAWKAYQAKNPDTLGVVLETAHPAKFLEEVEEILSTSIAIPKSLAELSAKEKHAIPMKSHYTDFKTWLLDNLL